MKSNYKAGNKGILIIYNTCTLRHIDFPKEAWDSWRGDIDQILSQSIFTQEDLNCKLVVCECRGSDVKQWENDLRFRGWLDELKSHGVYYNVIKQYLPFGQSVNHIAKKIVELNNSYEYYVYWSSGLRIQNDIDQLLRIYKLLLADNSICRANLLASNDNVPPEDFTDTTVFTVIPGQAVNDHCSVYSNEFFESFNKCIRPDIYVGNGSENAFSYMAASIGKRSVILPTNISPALLHNKNCDGVGNPGIRTRQPNWYIKYMEGGQVTDNNPYGVVYLNDPDELDQKSARCEAAKIVMMEPHSTGRIGHIPALAHNRSDKKCKFIIDTYGDDGMKLKVEEQRQLNKVLRKEFFVQDFDYDNIKGELLWKY
tara:strand:+ start:189 stop:1295 length:1107 start_codon:yes stop_codon:yes gene_type:complete